MRVLTEQSLVNGRKYIVIPKVCQIKECHNPIAAYVDGSHFRIFVCADHAADNREHTTSWHPRRTCEKANCDRPPAYILQYLSVAGSTWTGTDGKDMRCQVCFDKMVVALSKPTEIIVDGVTYARKRET